MSSENWPDPTQDSGVGFIGGPSPEPGLVLRSPKPGPVVSNTKNHHKRPLAQNSIPPTNDGRAKLKAQAPSSKLKKERQKPESKPPQYLSTG